MTTTDYRPIACDRYSEYEVMAMRRSWVRLDADTPEGPHHDLRCQVLDVRTRDGAEFLEVLTEGGERLGLRLDCLSGVRVTE